MPPESPLSTSNQNVFNPARIGMDWRLVSQFVHWPVGAKDTCLSGNPFTYSVRVHAAWFPVAYRMDTGYRPSAGTLTANITRHCPTLEASRPSTYPVPW